MAEAKVPPYPTQQTESNDNKPKEKPLLTRRDFFVRSNAGAVAVGMMTGTGFAASLIQAPPKPAAAPKPTAVPPPIKTRKVTLDIDGKKYDCNVDVRESLWETMNYQLGLSNCNQGCDRAECGACAVLVDGKAVNACTLLTARYGRGQKIVTVAGISKGPGPQGLHPLQRAFWLDGGFQCGICTRGFIMSAYALLQTNNNPTTAEIKEAVSGNICRCGEYPKIITAVKKAAAELRGEKVTYAAPLPLVTLVAATSQAAPPANAVSKQFEFATALGTIEQFDDLSLELKEKPGIVGLSGSERTITVSWDPGQLDEGKVRQILSESGHPVK
ncbi:MAG: (2Fe-2S)-binding protein [Acidobacteria bacterium]|nr:(2Fe-2S)-binding protein [Acidobacteriota bacterium]